MAYVGQSRSSGVIAKLTAHGVGEMWTAGQDYWPPRRSPFAIDCGTFRHWRAGTEWDSTPFLTALEACKAQGLRPDFVVAPDRITKGLESLVFSLSWLPVLEGFPVVLAVQDGMSVRQVGRVLHRFAGIFVGGSLPWKIKTSREWVKLAHRHGKPCHIGRVGIPKRVRWAERIGADSVDSCQPLWSKENLTRWLAAFHPSDQLSLEVA
jgi:hypothetical protein